MKAASERVVVGDRTVVLSTEAWRNFAPAPLGPRPLIVALTLTADSPAFPDGLRVERVWVFHRDETWTTQALEFIGNETGSGSAAGLTYGVRGGPEWPIGDGADVVVRITTPNSQVYFLQNRGIRIGAPS